MACRNTSGIAMLGCCGNAPVRIDGQFVLGSIRAAPGGVPVAAGFSVDTLAPGARIEEAYRVLRSHYSDSDGHISELVIRYDPATGKGHRESFTDNGVHSFGIGAIVSDEAIYPDDHTCIRTITGVAGFVRRQQTLEEKIQPLSAVASLQAAVRAFAFNTDPATIVDVSVNLTFNTTETIVASITAGFASFQTPDGSVDSNQTRVASLDAEIQIDGDNRGWLNHPVDDPDKPSSWFLAVTSILAVVKKVKAFKNSVACKVLSTAIRENSFAQTDNVPVPEGILNCTPNIGDRDVNSNVGVIADEPCRRAVEFPPENPTVCVYFETVEFRPYQSSCCT